jgi:branched-chain amino acid transport system permease protein
VILTWVNYTGMKEIGNAVNNTFGTTIQMPHYQFLIFGFVLVLMMLFRRDGILPAARQKQSRALDEQLEKIGTTEETPA